MSKFNYEWWTVRILDTSGWNTWEFKGKSKENVVRQINKEVAYTNSKENANRPFWERKARIIKVDWDSLTLDRIGYQRLF